MPKFLKQNSELRIILYFIRKSTKTTLESVSLKISNEILNSKIETLDITEKMFSNRIQMNLPLKSHRTALLSRKIFQNSGRNSQISPLNLIAKLLVFIMFEGPLRA